MEDTAPPLKRRRTSQDDSPTSSRPQSRQSDLPYRHASTTHSVDIDPEQTSTRDSRHISSRHSIERSPREGTSRPRSYRQRSQSSEYSPRSARQSLSRSPRRRESRSTSASYRTTSPGVLRPLDSSSSNPFSFKSLYTLPHAHSRGITSVKFSPDLSLLAVASADTTITIYTVQPTANPPLKHLRTLRAHLAGVNALAWSPIGPNYTLASASDDKSILLWSPLSSDFPISPSPLTGHSNYVFSLAFSPKGNMLVSGSYDEAVFLWDVRSARVMRTLPAHSDPVSGVDFLRDGSMVCSCASDGLIRIWDSGTGQCLKTLVDEDRKPVSSVRFTPNGKFVCAWTLDGCIRLWKYTEGRCVKTYTGHVNEEYRLGGTVGDYGVGLSDAFVVSGSEDGDLVAWDVSSKEMLWRGKGHEDVVLSVDFGRLRDIDGEPTGRGLLISGGKDRALRLWVEDTGDGDMVMDGEHANRTATSMPHEDEMDVDVGTVEAALSKAEGDFAARGKEDVAMQEDNDGGET